MVAITSNLQRLYCKLNYREHILSAAYFSQPPPPPPPPPLHLLSLKMSLVYFSPIPTTYSYFPTVRQYEISSISHRQFHFKSRVLMLKMTTRKKICQSKCRQSHHEDEVKRHQQQQQKSHIEDDPELWPDFLYHSSSLRSIGNLTSSFLPSFRLVCRLVSTGYCSSWMAADNNTRRGWREWI